MTAPRAAIDRDVAVRRNARLLSFAQVALWGALGVFATFGLIAGDELTHRGAAGPALFGVYYLAVATGARVAGRLMDRRGRRVGLAGGYLTLALSGILAFGAILAGTFIGLLASSVVLGLGAGAALLGRAAVADMHPPEQRGRAVGRLVMAGTLGAVGGPPLGSAVHALAESWGGTDPIAVPFLLVMALALLGLSFVASLRPDPRDLAIGAASEGGRPRPPRTVLALRATAIAVAAIAVGQVVMVTFMSVVPVVVRHHGAAPMVVSVVVSLHFAGMLALSQPIGAALDRWGRRAGLLAGAVLSAGGVALGLLSTATPVATVGLFLIGLGWSAAYLGSTAVVSDVTTSSERAGALGLADLVAAISAAVGVFGGAVLLEAAGFTVLSWVSLGLLAVPVALLLPRRDPSGRLERVAVTRPEVPGR